jgi:hypothetical protein
MISTFFISAVLSEGECESVTPLTVLIQLLKYRLRDNFFMAFRGYMYQRCESCRKYH